MGFVACLCTGVMAGILVGPANPAPASEALPSDRDEVGTELDRRRVISLYTFDTKERLLAKLVAGQWSLREAAECFELLDEQKAYSRSETVVEQCAGTSLERRYCLAVLDRLQNSSVLPNGSKRALIMRRLQAELETVRDEEPGASDKE